MHILNKSIKHFIQRKHTYNFILLSANRACFLVIKNTNTNCAFYTHRMSKDK